MAIFVAAVDVKIVTNVGVDATAAEGFAVVVEAAAALSVAAIVDAVVAVESD